MAILISVHPQIHYRSNFYVTSLKDNCNGNLDNVIKYSFAMANPDIYMDEIMMLNDSDSNIELRKGLSICFEKLNMWNGGRSVVRNLFHSFINKVRIMKLG
uniref:Uncharacterized protein n=1 Tax=Meloidogyne enterolobii TaxID=390850 RepID=A0A6V7U5Y4_MELEN|nr:unnamed protein product [Meloidogyne enterolobii]